MTNEIRNVSLSFPCREDWDKFEVVPGGRLCSKCTLIVRDFQDCSMAELQEAMKSGKRICGRFRKDQLSPSFLKAASVLAVMTTATACENDIPKPAIDQPRVESIELLGDVEVIEETVTTLGIVVEVEADTVKKDMSSRVNN